MWGGVKKSKSGKNSKTTQLEPEGAMAQRKFPVISRPFAVAQTLISLSVSEKGGFSTTKADGKFCFFLTGRGGGARVCVGTKKRAGRGEKRVVSTPLKRE